ncbi:ABC transporter permease [Calditrichota bacterium]
MILNYIKIAFRNVTKRLTFTFINIFGLVVGMTCSILIMLWVNHEMSYDEFNENSDRIFRIVTQLNFVENTRLLATTPAPVAPALKEKFPEVEEFTRIYEVGRRLVSYNENTFLEPRFYFADPQIFNMFTFPVLEGTTALLEQDINTVVLTHKMAEKYFGTENPIGKILNIDELGDLKVIGVIENVTKNSHLKFDFIAPFELLRRLNEPLDGWGRFRYYSYIMLNKNTHFSIVQDKISSFFVDSDISVPANLHMQPLPTIYFDTDYGVDIAQHGNKNSVYIIFTIALLILLIACINYMNLTTAYGGKRAKEVGLRKVAGAVKLDIIKQYFNEAIIYTLIAFIISLVCVELLITPYNILLGTNLELNYFDNHNILWGLFLLVLFTGIIAGSYPALFLSSFSPVRVFQGLFNKGYNKAPLRKILIVTQFTLSIALIIAAITVYYQLQYIKDKSLGFDKEQILFVPLRGDIVEKIDVVKSELLQNPVIESVSAANALPHRIGSMTSGISWEGKDLESRELFRFASVDFDFVNTFNIPIVEGRNFSKEFTTDIGKSFLINEEAARSLGFESPVGKKIVFQEQEVQIIGIVKDFHFRSLYEPIEPVFLGILTERYQYFNLFVKTRSGDVSAVKEYIENIWKKHNSKYPFDYYFLDESVDNVYKPIEKLQEIFIYFSVIAIALSCLGLFGLASFMTEQRIKEIGIRKVLGASISGILILLSKEFTKWVIIANIIAWPLAWFAMNHWLQEFAYRIDIGWWVFFLSGTIAFIIALLTVSSQAIKSAIANPVESLSYE